MSLASRLEELESAKRGLQKLLTHQNDVGPGKPGDYRIPYWTMMDLFSKINEVTK